MVWPIKGTLGTSLLHAGQYDMSRDPSISSKLYWSDLVRRYFDIGQRGARLLTIQVLERADQRRKSHV
jgi:hypothetical protein